MDSLHEIEKAAAELRATAAGLTKQAERLDAAANAIREAAASEAARLEPLEPAASDDEAAARLIALEASSSGRAKDDVLAQLKRDFPSVDVESLVARFYS